MRDFEFEVEKRIDIFDEYTRICLEALILIIDKED
jgi:hypothetical protein